MPTNNTILTGDGKDSSSSTQGSSTASRLVPRTLFAKLLIENRKNLVLRALSAMIIGPSGIPGSSLDFAIKTRDSMEVHRLAPGEEIPLDAEKYSGFNLKPLKYGVRIDLPKEIEEDSNWGMLDMNINTAAFELADNEESLIVATWDTGSGVTDGTRVANSNASLGPSDIVEAMRGLRRTNHDPTHLVIGNECESDLYLVDSFVEAHKSGVSDPSKKLMGTIYNMKVIMSNNVSAKYAYVLDSTKAFLIAEKRTITMEKYKAPERDSIGAVVTQRFAARYLFAGAIARIITT